MEKSFFSRLHGAMMQNVGTEDVLQTAYGLPSDRAYDAVIVAPAWVPEKLLKHTPAKITPVVEMSVCRTYEIEIEGRLLAWVQTGTGAGNVIDIALSLHTSAAKKVIFVGSVGALDADVRIGEIATPSHSVAGDGASLYLYETLDPANFFRREKPHTEAPRPADRTGANRLPAGEPEGRRSHRRRGHGHKGNPCPFAGDPP